MTAEVWHPMSAREAGTTGLREGLPPAFRRPLQDWVYWVARERPSMVQRIRVRVAILPWNPADTGDSEEAAREFLATAPDQSTCSTS
jgi:hypothetical protein